MTGSKVRTTAMTKRHKRSGGFTLIEVLLVVAILGILAGVVVVNLGGKREGAQINATRASLGAVSKAVELYEVDTGRYPAALQALLTDDGSPNWNGPYLKGGAPKDAWGQPVKLEVAGRTFKVVSDGPPGAGKPITSFEF